MHDVVAMHCSSGGRACVSMHSTFIYYKGAAFML